ncbi:MAG: hypothetical protein JSU69_11910 [Candidatus Zixiibacteriota bacterium]|nr:MAG: hypothetical protein JSU69_11910 [candidate division Zixibacteria bacterium]
MKLGYLKEKKELAATVMLAIAVLSVILIVVKVRGFFMTTANARSAVEEAINRSKPDDKNVTAQLDKFKKEADALKKKNLFSPPPPRQNPVRMVMGVIGDEAFINGKWYKAGAKVADAKILSVEPTAVTIEWDGKKTVFNPIDGGASSGPSGPSRPGRPTASRRPGGGGQPGMVVTEGPAPRPGGGGPPHMPGGGGGFMERMRNMSEADRDRLRSEMMERRERYMNASPEEREKMREEMRERFGGGRGPGGGRGGPGGGRGGRR